MRGSAIAGRRPETASLEGEAQGQQQGAAPPDLDQVLSLALPRHVPLEVAQFPFASIRMVTTSKARGGHGLPSVRAVHANDKGGAQGTEGMRACTGALSRAAAGESLVPLPVARELWHLVEAAAQAPEQPRVEPAVGRSQRVVLPDTVLPDAHEARLAEVREMPRHRRLRGAEDGNEVSHAYLLVLLEQVEDAQPRAIGEGSEHPIDARSLHRVIVVPQNGIPSNEASTPRPSEPGLAASSTT